MGKVKKMSRTNSVKWGPTMYIMAIANNIVYNVLTKLATLDNLPCIR